MLNPPGEPIHCVVSSSLIKIVGPSFAVGFLAREHVKDTAHDRVCHSDNRPILPNDVPRGADTTLRDTSPSSVRRHGRVGSGWLGGDVPLAGFARPLLACTFIIARGHTSPGSQTRCGFKPCHINADLCHDYFCTALVDPRNGVQEFDSACKGERGRGYRRRDVACDGPGSLPLAADACQNPVAGP